MTSKPARAPKLPKPAGAIPHKTKALIVERLVKADNLAVKGVWPRELNILQRLTQGKYENADFWMTLGLGFSLNSLAWFNMPEGKLALERAWRLYHMAAQQGNPPQRSNSGLDTESNSRIVESSTTESAPPPERKPSLLEWADSV